MSQQRQLTIADQRAVTPRLRWLTLSAPRLTRSVRAGQYLLVRCAEEGSYDPLLRRPLFVAAAESALGQIGMLYEPDERGLAWLARGRSGDALDIVGPQGQPFAVHERTRNLLLIGEGPGLTALLFLARESAAKGRAVTLLAGAVRADALPPPFLLPGEVEYQSIVGRAIDLLNSNDTAPDDESTRRQGDKVKQREHIGAQAPLHPLAWADQVCVALPNDQLLALRGAIQAIKYRWERGFASALLEGPIVCGVGTCGVCAVEMRKGTRMLCSDGPVFDLRDVGRDR
jgi:dihydroorotate dehydrogenase electron transfer subunit